MKLTRDDLLVGVMIPAFFVVSIVSLMACGRAFPGMHFWRSDKFTIEAVLYPDRNRAFTRHDSQNRGALAERIGSHLISILFANVERPANLAGRLLLRRVPGVTVQSKFRLR